MRYIHCPGHPNADEFNMVEADRYYPIHSDSKRINVIRDVEPFVSPIDGSLLGSRAAIREHEKRHGVRQCGNDWTGRSRPEWWDRRKEMVATTKKEV